MLSFLTSILVIYISFITASRSGLLFAVLMPVLYWLFIFKSYKVNSETKLILVSILIILSLSKLYSLYNNSYLKNRVEQSLESGDSRGQLINDAITVFKEHFFTGVGPGQFYLYSFNKSSFSHNSYAEMAANLGIVGLVLLLILYVTPFIQSIRIYFANKKIAKRSILKLNIYFFFFFLLYNNFYVFYLTTFGMMFFMIVLNIQKKNKFYI